MKICARFHFGVVGLNTSHESEKFLPHCVPKFVLVSHTAAAGVDVQCSGGRLMR